MRTKYNKYQFLDKIGIGYFNNTDRKFLFDKEDYEKIKKYTWCEKEDNGRKIAQASIKINNKWTYIYLHWLIIGKENIPKNYEIDHINGDTLDNRKCNLRIVTHSDNMKNKKLRKNNTSGIAGVYKYFYKNSYKWRANITVNKKRISLGLYDNLEDAIQARLKAEKDYFGEYSRIFQNIT